MKNSEPPFAYIKTIALIAAFVALVLVSGFISSKTLLTGTPIQNPPGPNINASLSESAANVNTGETGTRDVLVWVNTNSGVYHCPNTRWYGKTKSGKYMTQREAQAKGYRPAYGAKCG